MVVEKEREKEEDGGGGGGARSGGGRSWPEEVGELLELGDYDM